MKVFPFLFFLLFVSCADTINIPCGELEEGMIEADVTKVKPWLDLLMADLHPMVSAEDPFGHRENLEIFIDQLNAQCNFNAVIECYACIETFPPQSHVQITLTSSNVIPTFRTLDIRTPADAVMKIVNIHPL